MTERTLRGAVVGAGLIGTARALDFVDIADTHLAYVCEPDPARGQALAAKVAERQGAPCDWTRSHDGLVSGARVDVALVAVPHDVAAGIVRGLLTAGINTLVEKPMGVNLGEAQELGRCAEQGRGRLAVGFNYRHYPAIARAREIVASGGIGRVLFMRMLVGHGGRPGYEQEWKVNLARSGGGALLDPGIHLIDLARFFLGEVRPVHGHLVRLFWRSDVEDLAIAVLAGDQGSTVSLQASIIEWRNQFSVQIFGEQGYLRIDGRMGNYGPQTLTQGKRWAWLGGKSQAASEQIESFGDRDTSFAAELREVVEAFRRGGPLPADHRDGLEAMRLVDELYRLSGWR